MAHTAIQNRKHKRELDSSEDLEMREPLKAGTTSSVALFLVHLPIAGGVAEK